MLIEFTVANYRSFRDEATLSMVANPLTTGNGESDDRNLFKDYVLGRYGAIPYLGDIRQVLME